MESLEVASPSLDVKIEEQSQSPMEPQTEPQVDVDASNKNKNKKKKKKKNRRKSLERTQSEVEDDQLQDAPEQEEDEEEKENNEKKVEVTTEEYKEKTAKVHVDEEAAVTGEEEKEETTVETTEETAEVHDDDEAAVSGEEMSLERQTSLDSLKATGTRAVGSLFSRFKVGRKKAQPSRSELVVQLEQVNPSPVKTAVKRLEVPEEKNLDDLPMRTKRDFFLEERSIHVSAEKEKYDTMEKQTKLEKKAEEAAKQTPPSSSRSNEELLAQVDAPKEHVELSEVSEVVVTSVSVKAATIEASEESSEVVADITIDSGEGESVAAVEATMTDAQLENDQAATTNMEEDTELAADTSIETSQPDASPALPASLKLDLDLDINTNAAQSTPEKVDEVVIDSTGSEETSVETVSSNGATPDVTSPNEETEIISIKVPPTPEIPAEVSAPEKMSPVKSLASRFEGKREQSLDSLKFRTVREFFSDERSIQVGAEKQKYEALAQQQNLKTKAEEEAKSKYNATKSPVKESTMATNSLHRDLNASTRVKKEVAVAAEPATAGFATPETVASRKKFSFDERSVNSPSKLSDDASEASTPVKSIASRFEGKREQSLDNLKFRTVREFFPEERSVRVGSEKQKLEAQAQQENSLDKLKFRTVREFFPSDDKRSVHVGAEKAKFEALTKQQEEAVKTAEHIKQKHAAHSPSPFAVKAEIHDIAAAPVATKETISTQRELNPVVSVPNDEAAGSVNESNPSERVADDIPSLDHVEPSDVDKIEEAAGSGKESNPSEPVADYIPSLDHVEPSDVQKAEEVNSTLTSSEGKFVIKENASVADTQINELDAARPEPVGANDDEEDIATALTEKSIISLEGVEYAMNQETEVDQKLDQEETEQEISHEIANSVEEFVGDDVDLLDEPVAETQADSTAEASQVGTAFNDDTTLEPVLVGQESVEIVEQVVASDGLMELDLGDSAWEEPVPTVVDAQGVDPSHEQLEESQPEKSIMLTTERSFVMEDNVVETEDTIVVSERPMTDGEDELGPVSPTKAHELFAGITSSSIRRSPTSSQKAPVKLAHSSPKLTRKLSAGSTGLPITTSTASYMAKKAAEAEKFHRSTPQLKKEGSVSKLKGTISDTGFIKPPPAAPTVPVPMKRASITAPTASYVAKKAAEAKEDHRASSQPKWRRSISKGTVSDTGFLKPPPAAPTVPVPMNRASITAPTASWQARHVKPTPKDPVAPKRASIMAQEVVPNKRYSGVRSKVFEGIEARSMHAVTHKTITKEEFIAAERRKSLGSAGVRSVLDTVDRRASLTPRSLLAGPPEPFMRAAFARKKLDSTTPRYMNYENTPGYADRARVQYERRRRLEEENAMKSEKRQRELRMHFAEKQQKASTSSAEEVRRGLEAHEFSTLAKESEIAAQKALRKGKRALSARSHHRALSTTSSNGFASKKSSVSSIEEKIVKASAIELTVVEAVDTVESTRPQREEDTTEVQEVEVEETTIPVPIVDEDPTLENVAKKIDFDEASSDSDEKDVSNE